MSRRAIATGILFSDLSFCPAGPPADANPVRRVGPFWPAGCQLGFQPHGHHFRRLVGR
jgi:hypothetical protein